MCCRCWHVPLIRVKLIWIGTIQGEVLFQNIHLTIASIPHSVESIWAPLKELHENETHCETMSKNKHVVHSLKGRVFVEVGNHGIPPALRPIKNIGSTLPRRKSVKKTSNFLLLCTTQFEFIALQISKFLFTDASIDMCVSYLFLKRKPCISCCLKSALEGRDTDVSLSISNQLLDALANLHCLCTALFSEFDEIVSLFPV
mmetsp:Transcript_31096/g.54015  ORF Transcript_31096/g.54015 Transcript_31096/m.54015 type:complete len:201 (-) Transcript_31096:51-653(-)